MTADDIDLEIARNWQKLGTDEREALIEELADDEVAVLAAALEAQEIAP